MDDESSSPREVTRLLAARGQGDALALEKLTRLVYEELRRLDHRYMGQQRDDHTQTTALVNEAYPRLAGQEQPNFANRSHFLAVAAKAMRQILVDHAKATPREKRGARAKAVELDEVALLSPEPTREILDLNEALDVSVVTVRRDWTFSRAWLCAELSRVD